MGAYFKTFYISKIKDELGIRGDRVLGNDLVKKELFEMIDRDILILMKEKIINTSW